MKKNISEEEYFAKEEARKREKKAKAEAEKRQKDEAEALKNLHWMHCPKCGQELKPVTLTAKGFQVDQCPNCRGIWFDKGEVEILRKFIEGPKNMADKIMGIFRSAPSKSKSKASSDKSGAKKA